MSIKLLVVNMLDKVMDFLGKGAMQQCAPLWHGVGAVVQHCASP